MFGSGNRLRSFELKNIIQTSLDGFWIARAKDARIMEVNEAFCNMVGYSREALLTMCISDLEADESPTETAAHIKKIMKAGSDRFETRHRHKLGHMVNLEVSVSYSDVNGGIFFVFARDITERKRTEDTLYFIAQRGWIGSAENYFDALAQYLGESLGVDYIVIDRLDKSPGIADTVALYAKSAIVPNIHYALKGTPCENVMGRKFCFYPQGVQQLFPDDALLVEMGAESYAGIPLWDSAGLPIGLIAVMDSKPLADEAAIFRLLQLVAIRAAAELERERSDRILREREQEFRSLAENLPDNIARWDRAGRYLYLNPTHELTLRTPAAEALGKRTSEIFPDGRFNQAEQLVFKIAETGEPQFIRVPVPQQDGSLRFHEVNYVPERNAQGEIVSVLGIGRDMTEQIRMQEAIIQSEAALSSLTDSAPFFIIRYDIEGRITYVNAPLLGFFGIPLAELIGKLPREVWPDGRFEKIDRGIAQVLETKAEAVVEFSELSTEGKTLHHQVWVVPEKSSLNEVLGVIAFGLDITERKRMEGELRVRENESRRLAQFRHSLLSGMRDAGIVLVVVEDGHFVYTNDHYVGCQLGYAKGQLPETVSFINLIHPDDRPRIAEMHRDRLAGKPVPTSYEIGALAGDGSRLEYEFHVTLVPDTDPPQTLLLALDIGGRKRTEMELQRSESEFRALAENMPDTLIHYDREGRRTYINPALKRISAVREEQMIGLTQQESNPFSMPEVYRLALERALASGELSELELQIPTPSGDIRTNLILIAAERAADGQISGAITIGRDITKLKQAEQQLRELTAHLQTVREEEKAHLAREIHDDLASTLAVLNLKLSHLLDFEFPEDMKKMPLFARLGSMAPLLENAIATTRRIITNMRPDVLDNLGLFAALKWQAGQFHKHTGIGCRIVCADDHDCVDCKGCKYQLDKTLSINLFRIFQEALTNVARHSGASSVEVVYRAGNGDVLLSISDNGCGLPEEHSPSSTSFGIRGMRERVGQLCGQIEFDSPPGGGFSVMVRLPLLLGKQAGD